MSWEIYAFMAVATAISQRGKGYAAKGKSELEVRQIKAEKKRAALQHLQQHNQRMEQLEAFQGANEAAAGAMGRDIGTDRSLKKIQEKASREISIETDRARVAALGVRSKLDQQMTMSRLKASNINRASRYQAFTTLVSGGMQAKGLMPNSGGTGLGTRNYIT